MRAKVESYLGCNAVTQIREGGIGSRGCEWRLWQLVGEEKSEVEAKGIELVMRCVQMWDKEWIQVFSLHTGSSLDSPFTASEITEARTDVSVGGKELGFGSVKFELYIKH